MLLIIATSKVSTFLLWDFLIPCTRREATEVLHKYRTSYRTHPPKIPYNTVHFQNKNTVHTVHSTLPVPYIPKKNLLYLYRTHTKKFNWL